MIQGEFAASLLIYRSCFQKKHCLLIKQAPLFCEMKTWENNVLLSGGQLPGGLFPKGTDFSGTAGVLWPWKQVTNISYERSHTLWADIIISNHLQMGNMRQWPGWFCPGQQGTCVTQGRTEEASTQAVWSSLETTVSPLHSFPNCYERTLFISSGARTRTPACLITERVCSECTFMAWGAISRS